MKNKKLAGYLLALIAIIFVGSAIVEVFFGLVILAFVGWAFIDVTQVSDRILLVILTISLISYPLVVVSSIFLADNAFRKDKLMIAIYLSMLPVINIIIVYAITHLN